MTPELRCPVCSATLYPDHPDHPRSLRCAEGHTFDRAKQGYWNLLLTQRKRSRAPGDNEQMVQARQRFLEQGYYQPIATAITETLQPLLQSLEHSQLLDLGCGEGYYTRQIAEHLPNTTCIGLDISKAAIREASKQDKNLTWLVATGADIPLPEASSDAATLIFARLLPEPTARILKPGGYFLVVWPGPDHLRELREQIYTEVRDSDLNPDAQLHEYFEVISTQTLRFRFGISDTQSLSDLLMMTPHGQRLSQSRREQLLTLDRLEIQGDIRLSLYRKR